MLIRPHDRGPDALDGDDSDVWRTFVAEQGFGHLCVADGDVPVVVPTQFVVVDDEVLLHLAKPNPIFEALERNPRALLSIAGDWAYIPGAWKAIGDEDPSLGIPTTYYAAVQIIGAVTVVDDPDGIAAILRQQLNDVEPDGGLQDPMVHAGQFRVIRGLRLSIESVRTKFKFGGNADDEHRAAVAQRLTERAGPGDLAAARRVPRG